MKIKTILAVLEEMAPLAYAESFDNVGLLCGNLNREVSGILICHDALEKVVDEAISKNLNLIHLKMQCLYFIITVVIKLK